MFFEEIFLQGTEVSEKPGIKASQSVWELVTGTEHVPTLFGKRKMHKNRALKICRTLNYFGIRNKP